MSCASCVLKGEEGLKRTEGVQTVAVNFAAQRAAIAYDPDEVRTERFVDVVRSLGYDVPVRSVQLPVRGMSCASCVEKVEHALSGVDGALPANVHPASERATAEAPATP